MVTLLGADPPLEPHATTEPSDFSAAKAFVVADIFTTFELAAVTETGAVPPAPAVPHVTTEPSDLRAAKAK